ncbi:GCR1-dependent translation factor 1 [Neocucurbitaria cava]|uniref:GCR1-dependent translation factor 1 n=1 Tax=Neocucurbitaria cava TaxID=798079 RepID=A0A9W8YGX8_9PLEO|nr:GCR1-dependent translation factor 1 [Neocucurbitaria cava]
MRLRPSQTHTLLLLLPALRVLATSIAVDTADKPVARAAVPAYTLASSLPDASPTPASPGSKGTKDAPVDGLDGKPHAGPYVDDTPTSHDKKPNVVEDLRPGKTPASSLEDSTTLVEADDSVLDGDKSVMQDPDRKLATGSTGTEGGVSAKDKERLAHEEKTGEKMEKVPESPKEAPPQPHADQKQLGNSPMTTSTTRVLGAVGLEKPTGLPDTPHDVPHPVPGLHDDTDPLDIIPKTKTPASLPDEDVGGGVIQPFHSFVLSFTMIIFSEIGDKTFLVAALMAMRHPRLLVFSAAFSALVVMTVLSAVLGHAVPALLNERFTHFAAAALFLVFGIKLIREGLAMSPNDGVGEEMREVEQELEEKEQLARHQKGRRTSSISPYALEAGRARRSRSNSRLPAPARSPSTSPDRSPSPNRTSVASAMGGLNNLFSLLLSPAWVQTFIMTFLGEWGDRSQIATVAMAAGSDYWWVTAGAVVGHGLCTAGAVIGGRAIAGRISMRNVTLGGAFAFLVFGVIYLLEAFYHE